MSSACARVEHGQRAHATERHNYGKNMILLAGLRLEGMCAPFVIEGDFTNAVFETYIERGLLPELHPGDILILDNLTVHKSLTAQRLLDAHTVTRLYLSTYSLDFSPVENAFAKLKAVLRKVRAQTIDALLDTIARHRYHFSRRCWLFHPCWLVEPRLMSHPS